MPRLSRHKFVLSWVMCATSVLAPVVGAQYLPRPFTGSIKTSGTAFSAQRIEVVLLMADGRPRERVFADGLGNFQLSTLTPGNRYILIIEVAGFKRIEQAVESSAVGPGLTQR